MLDLAAVVLDFDGVILESAEIKTDAFREIFASYPEAVDAIVAYHRRNAGMGRLAKLRIIYRDILRLPFTEDQATALAQRFAEVIAERVLSCPPVPGAPELIEWCAARYPLFVASGVPEDELRDVMDRRGLTRFFQGVFGSPRDKEAILSDLTHRGGWPAARMLMVGDALTDARAAAAVGAPFVGRVHGGAGAPEGEDVFEGEPRVAVVRDLFELRTIWPRIVAS